MQPFSSILVLAIHDLKFSLLLSHTLAAVFCISMMHVEGAGPSKLGPASGVPVGRHV